MRLILDTHYVYALVGVGTPLTKRERAYFGKVSDQLVVSAVSIWEIRLKWSALGKSGSRKGPASAGAVMRLLRTQTIDYLALTLEHAETELDQPITHRDPFDELLLAQAQAERVHLLTRDSKLISHPLAQAI